MKNKSTESPVRVLYVENGIGYGGAIICLRHLVRNLDREQFSPMVVTGWGTSLYQDIARDAPWKHIPDRRIDVVRMRRTLQDSTWARRVPGLRAIALQIIARLDDVGNFLPFFLQFLWTTLRFRPQIIHVNNEPLCNRASILAGKLLRIPVVCHVRGDQRGSRMMRWLYRQPDHFIPVSHWISEGIGGLGIEEEKRTVVYDGIALEDLDLHADGARFRRAHGIPDDAFAVGLVGLLIPWKGQNLFLDAAKVLANEIPGLRMLIIGGTPDECQSYERELRERVIREGLQNLVVFTGHVQDMPAVYNALDVVVSASTSPEPLGTVVIETMAMGAVLIAPDHGGAAEMADHDRTALLFRPGDPPDLARMIRRIYREPGLGARLGAAAREHALKTFAVETHVQGVQAVYRHVLARTSRS